MKHINIKFKKNNLTHYHILSNISKGIIRYYIYIKNFGNNINDISVIKIKRTLNARGDEY